MTRYFDEFNFTGVSLSGITKETLIDQSTYCFTHTEEMQIIQQ